MLLIVKAKTLSLDVLKLVVLCAEHMDISYDTGVSKMIKGIVDNKSTSTAGVEDGVIGVFNTRTMEVGGGEGMCMERGAIDSSVLALHPLMNYSIVDTEVTNILGGMWSVVWTDIDERVVAGVAKVETHPLTTWVISVLHILSLGRDMGDFCWSGETMKEGRWGCVN